VATILRIPLTIVTFQQKFHCASENGELLLVVPTFDVPRFCLLTLSLDRVAIIAVVGFGGVRPCKERTVVTPSNVDDKENTKPITTVARIFRICKENEYKTSTKLRDGIGPT
jgi:hypothetical protein